MVKFLHAADLHLDSRLDGLQRYEGAPVERIRSACRRALENLVELAISEGVAFVLLAGDIYDGDWSDYNTGLYFIRQMARLNDAGIRIFMISGNHDAANRMTRALRLPRNVTMLSSEKPESHRLEDFGVVIHGQGFATGAVTEDLSRNYPPPLRGYFNIGLLHTCIEGAEGHDRYAPCTLPGLKNKEYDYWALGHIHKRWEVSKDPHVVYSGNIQGRHIRETGPKGCYLGTLMDNRLAGLEFRRLDVVRWEVCEVIPPESDREDELFDAAADQVESLLGSEDVDQLLAVRVVLTGRCKLHEQLTADPGHCAAQVRSRALDLGADRVWVEKVRVKTLPWSAEAEQGPLAELLAGLSELRADESRLIQEAEVFSELRDKLPAEFFKQSDSPRFDDRAWLLGILDEVEALLKNRLSPSESGR